MKMPSALLLFLAAAPLAGAPSAADYPLTFHLLSARYVPLNGYFSYTQQEAVGTIDGQGYLLNAVATNLISPGDYPARITTNKLHHNLDLQRTLELRFPNGDTRKYDVIGTCDKGVSICFGTSLR